VRRGLLSALLLLMGCGYHFEGSQSAEGTISISVPYIKGDGEGRLNSELTAALSASGMFDCVQNGGELILQAAIIADGDDRIGYRFDRDPTTGKLRDNIVGTENRRTMSAQVTLIDAHTQETVLGPDNISATADYDYVDQNSIADLAFITTHRMPQKVLDFSLGQLDSVDGAHDDSSIVVYRHLAQKIVDGLIVKNAIERFDRERNSR
jgi:outer membrane lipopolysaccharide assembly protein LptE/RlpB